MGHYFSLPHFGAGSPEVESLGCYFFRLASAHDCSPWQLLRHLRAWSEASYGDSGWPTISTSLFDRNLPMCGYGRATDRVANALVIATNVPTLRSGTLLSLQHVAASTAQRTLRTSRAWCPACYAEDLQRTNEPYDRLLWALVPIKRCALHRLMLLTQCPSCEAPQHYTVSAKKLSRCSSCGRSLIAKVSSRVPAPLPLYGEKLLHELVAAGATDPGLTLNWGSISAFYKKARKELSPNHLLRVRPCFTRLGMYPTLESLIQLATTFNVSLTDFQGTEPPAVTLPLYGPDNLPEAGHPHPRRSPATHLEVEAALKNLLNSQQPLPPFRVFCEGLGASQGYVSYRFPSLTKSYLHARRLARDATQKRKVKAAMDILRTGGVWEQYCDGSITQLKQLVREVSRLASVTIAVARKAVAAHQLASSNRHKTK